MSSGARCYEIRVEETLDRCWAQWFEGMQILPANVETGTLLRGTLADQAALYGLIGRLRDLNLTLLEVHRMKE
jgi:hypothetical protein